MLLDIDRILTQCKIDDLEILTDTLEKNYSISTIKKPSVFLTMIRAEDSIEKQKFYLGEAITTECEVAVDGCAGYGYCLGEEPLRAYAIAIVDALLQKQKTVPEFLKEFIDNKGALLKEQEMQEFERVMNTRVDFKLFEEE